MTYSAKFLVFLLFSKILLVSTQEGNFSFLVSGGYRPQEHTLVKHIVSIRLKESSELFGCKHVCGGSILSPQTILTAAHCLWNRNSGKKIDKRKIQIVARTPNRLRRTCKTQIIDVKKIVVHPNYDSTTQQNDIAIIRLKHDIFEDNLHAQRIELTEGPTRAKMKCTAVGWGTIFEKGPLAANALYVDAFILSKKLCKKSYPGFSKGMLCAGDLRDIESSICKGDYGGPLICDGKISGVVSFGRRCGAIPSVYTDVWYYRKWVMVGGNGRTSIKLMNVLMLALLVWIVN